VFLINVPFGVIGLALAGRLMPESRAEGSPGLDLAGTALVTIGLTAIVPAPDRGTLARLAGLDLAVVRSLAAPPLRVRTPPRRLCRRGGDSLLHP